MLGGVMDVQSFEETPSDGGFKRLIKGSGFMSVEVIQDQDHFLGMGIMHFQQRLDDLGEIHGGASIGHGDVSLSGEGFNGHE